MSFYDKAKRLLYQYVDVQTNIKKDSNFQSEFIIPLGLELRNCDDNLTDVKQLIYSGYLKAIDPLSKSTILCLVNSDNLNITSNLLILGHTISDIRCSAYIKPDNVDPGAIQELIESDSQVKLAKHPYFYRPETEHTLSQDELIGIQKSIIAWLEKYRIPVELNENNAELVVANSVRVKPPYNHESDYICPTRIVLQRVKRIIDSRPIRKSPATT